LWQIAIAVATIEAADFAEFAQVATAYLQRKHRPPHLEKLNYPRRERPNKNENWAIVAAEKKDLLKFTL
jgi:hypothetical protein